MWKETSKVAGYSVASLIPQKDMEVETPKEQVVIGMLFGK